MTSLLRRKRPITRRNITEIRHRAVACLCAASLSLLSAAIAHSARADDAAAASSNSAAGETNKKLNWRPFRPNQAEWLAELNQEAARRAREESAAEGKTLGEDPNARPQPKTASTRRDDRAVKQVQGAGGSRFDDDPFAPKTPAPEPTTPTTKAPAPLDVDTPTAPAQTTPIPTRPMPTTPSRRAPARSNPFPDEPDATLTQPPTGPTTVTEEPYTSEYVRRTGPTPILPSASSPGCSADGPACNQELANLMKNTIDKIDLTIEEKGLPGKEYPCECTLGDAKFTPRDWPCITYTWKATALCHKPLYFEEPQLERYGHSRGPILDPFISTAHFFVSVPLLPYKMGVEPFCECEYSLGYYRPGSCAPWMIEPIPLSLRGALFEAGAATGTAFMITP